MMGLSFKRLRSLQHKESIQARRDPLTLRLIIAMPIMQLLLFGYAINTNPKHLPTGVLAAEHSNYERTLIAALQNQRLLRRAVAARPSERRKKGSPNGELIFVVNIPAQFRSFGRPRRIPVRADRRRRHRSHRDRLCHGGAGGLGDGARSRPAADPTLAAVKRRPFQFEVHARYNPEQLTVLNIVPGLICIVLIFSTLLSPRSRSPASASAARWKISWPCRCGRSR